MFCGFCVDVSVLLLRPPLAHGWNIEKIEESIPLILLTSSRVWERRKTVAILEERIRSLTTTQERKHLVRAHVVAEVQDKPPLSLARGERKRLLRRHHSVAHLRDAATTAVTSSSAPRTPARAATPADHAAKRTVLSSHHYNPDERSVPLPLATRQDTCAARERDEEVETAAAERHVGRGRWVLDAEGGVTS